ncbi:MAG: hypothetical protein E7637_05400 [Ruminococcaceae bacterium]|nr:hypothetical protein [Oscillospiraceae bacterium]
MRAAFYETEITPPLGGMMWGHYTDLRATDVQDRLYVKAAVIEDAGELAAIVCIDSCALPAEMHDIVTKRIQEYTGIDPSRVCLTSNHTHWGATFSDSPELNCYADTAYRDVCFRLTADAVILAYKRLGDAEASFGASELHGYSFCRDYVMEDGSVVTFGRGPMSVKGMLSEIDPAVSVVTFRRDGEPIGALINYTNHQCCCGHIEAYTGDYSSILSKELKKVYGPDFVSLFLQGTCGDINHLNDDRVTKATHDTYREIGRALAKKVTEAMQSDKPIGSGVLVKKELIRIPTRQVDSDGLRQTLREMLANDTSTMRIRNLVYYHATNKDTYKELWIQMIVLGNTCIWALPGEVFVDFGHRLKAESKFANNLVVELCNSYCGYIPTEQAFAPECDLYETSLCHHSCLIPEAGTMIVDRLLAMMDE